MPVPTNRSHMLPLDAIVRTAVREHPGPNTNVPRVIERARDALARGIVEVPPYDARTSLPLLQVCRFRCMMQDTGYPLEVYMPPSDDDDGEGEGEDGDGDDDAVDWTRLKERWVGWGVEVPGEQPWIKECLDGVKGKDVVEQMQTMQIGGTGGISLPDVVRGKWPLPAGGGGGGGEYQGALIKIYDPNVSFRPGTAYECVGLLSQSHLPASSQDFDADPAHQDALVPCLHLLADPRPIYPLDPSLVVDPNNAIRTATRDETITYLAGLLPRADRTAAEVLLLALIARVTAKAPGAVPLGTLALNLLLPRDRSKDLTDNKKHYPVFERLAEGIRAVVPLVVDIPLSIRLLSTHPFFPRSSHSVGGGGGGDGSDTSASTAAGDSLQAGLLQLAPSTVVLVNEDTLEGGALQDAAVRNLRALAETVRTQKLRYEFPYVGEDFGMETDLGFVVVGQGKSLLPVDLHMPLLGPESGSESGSISDSPTASRAGALAIAKYLAETRARSGDLVIPPDVVEFIQAEFIRLRREGLGVGAGGQKIEVGEADLRNWMRMGRLLAVSYPGATFTKDVWKRVLEIDLERRIRMDAR